MDESRWIYRVPRAARAVAPSDRWDSPAWRTVAPLALAHLMGDLPVHRPLAQAKLQYDARHLYLTFRVEDRYVRCVVRDYQGDVCTDSCVEFFFTPGTKISDGYFNIEANCGGTLLFTHRHGRDERVVPLPAEVARSLEVTHTLPEVVDPEVTAPVTWEIAYRVPWRLLRPWARVTRPAPGALWRANFYKCADLCSHPHWLTWAPVDWPQPDFHRPEFFGTLEFSA
jgi:hypothetical protein